MVMGQKLRPLHEEEAKKATTSPGGKIVAIRRRE